MITAYSFLYNMHYNIICAFYQLINLYFHNNMSVLSLYKERLREKCISGKPWVGHKVVY